MDGGYVNPLSLIVGRLTHRSCSLKVFMFEHDDQVNPGFYYIRDRVCTLCLVSVLLCTDIFLHSVDIIVQLPLYHLTQNETSVPTSFRPYRPAIIPKLNTSNCTAMNLVRLQSASVEQKVQCALYV